MLIRGFMLDSARCLEKHDYYKRFLEFAAARGINTILWHFTDDQGCSLKFDCEPDLASPNAFTKPQMRELLAHARALGIDVIPEVASLGHCVYITRLPQYQDLNESTTSYSGMCPLSPVTRRVLRALIEETASVFDSPNFHVGMDEANIGGHPLTRKALETRTKGEIFADHVNFLHEIVTRQNRRMWMWGDALLHDRSIAAKIPQDIVICNWQYAPSVPPATTRYFLDEGFDVMLCTALISHNQTLFPAETYALPNIRNLKEHEKLTGKGKILGSISTIWTPVRYMAESLWPGIDLAATMMREDGPVDVDRQIRQLATNFYGLSPDERWVEACRNIFKITPAREELMAVLKLENLREYSLEMMTGKAARWRCIARALQNTAPVVRLHREAYDAFVLMTELLAHGYEAAVRVMQEDMSDAASVIKRGHDLIARLDATWDRERYADDPRKHGAPIAHFQDDHLLPLLRTSVKRFSALAKDVELSGVLK